MGRMRVVCDQGDIVVSWNPNDPDSLEQARQEFARLREDGYEFFNKPSGKGRRRLKEFKADAGEIVAVPGVKTKPDKIAGTRRKAMAGGPLDRRVPTLP